MKFFEYKAEFFNEFETDDEHPYGKIMKSKGVTCAETYTEAMSNVEHFFDNIESLKITELEESACYDFNYSPYMFKGKNIKFGEKA